MEKTMKRTLQVFVMLALACASALGQVKGVRLIVTTGTSVRAEMDGLVSLSQASTAPKDFSVEVGNRKQAMRGFGGAFNEQGWVALQALDEKTRQALIKSIFDPSEANLSWGRIPIGASDYALDRYSLSPVANDFEMKSFSLERDRKYLIPYVKAAVAVRPDLKLWGSAWSPPVWMKDNGEYEAGHFIDKDEYYKAYALYLARFSEEYAKEGLRISAVAVQNEPTVVTGYPNCGWLPEQFRKFIRDYAGPLFAKRGLSTSIWLGTFNDPDYSYAKAVLDDPEAKKYVGAVALQWDGNRQIPFIKMNHPGVPIIQSETDCGNWHWKAGFDKDHAPNDFAYAAYTWKRIKDYISAGAEAYMLWNIVLDQNGKNIDKFLPWPQNSGIVVDTASKKVTYTPMFRAFEHFSRFVPNGSVALEQAGPMQNVVAFAAPSGAIVVELLNDGKSAMKIQGKVGDEVYAIELPAESFATLCIKRSF
jgi:glucosylceramidase